MKNTQTAFTSLVGYAESNRHSPVSYPEYPCALHELGDKSEDLKNKS